MFSDFLCKKCGKGYTNKHALYCHERYDCSLEKHLKCSYCPYKSSRAYNMKKHTWRNHERFHNATAPQKTKVARNSDTNNYNF